MTEQRVQRRLAAILAADVVGYSALMQRAEEATYAEFERLKRELIEPSFSRHEGRLIKTTGDGALVEFASPLAAIRCALEIQDRLAAGSSPLRLRVDARHANSAAPASCRHSHPSAIARSIPVRQSSLVPPDARNGALMRSI